jgi:hypothetical protein
VALLPRPHRPPRPLSPSVRLLPQLLHSVSALLPPLQPLPPQLLLHPLAACSGADSPSAPPQRRPHPPLLLQLQLLLLLSLLELQARLPRPPLQPQQPLPLLLPRSASLDLVDLELALPPQLELQLNLLQPLHRPLLQEQELRLQRQQRRLVDLACLLPQLALEQLSPLELSEPQLHPPLLLLLLLPRLLRLPLHLGSEALAQLPRQLALLLLLPLLLLVLSPALQHLSLEHQLQLLRLLVAQRLPIPLVPALRPAVSAH